MGILEDLKEQHNIDGHEYNVDEHVHATGGVAIGDHVEIIEDDEDNFAFAEGEEGEVVGITRTGPGTFSPRERIELLIVIDGMDPIVLGPDKVEVLG